MTEAYSKMIQQMMESSQEMLRAFNPALENLSVGSFEKMFPTMSKDMMEMWFGKTFNREGLDAKTRLLVTIGALTVLDDCSLNVAEGEIVTLLGPSGCGKSTFLRCLNRMNDTISGCSVTGDIRIDEEDVTARNVNPVMLRARVGMVFQEPNPFPKTVFENVAYGPKIHGLAATRAELEDIVETSLRRAGLWDEVKDSLHKPGTSLSGGQQQRLVIARAIAINPEIILMDEPCSALDPIATAKIEELIDELRENYCIIIVTH